MKSRGLWERAAEAYKLFGMGAMVAALVTILVILVSATVNGMVDGNYSVVVVTNDYGENFVELGLMILAIPAILSTARRLLAANQD
ncbi:MAG: hypothetical protein OK441_02870 [Thaumarchaeota archaeon]|nr:hypothetical protein [Nitrososphaerota archaeon]